MWIFFDLDGTLLDNLDAHYTLFTNFLRARGVRPTRAFFAECNGPSLREIMRLVRRRAQLKESAAELVRAYLAQLPRAYRGTGVIRRHATSTLKKLQRAGHRVMLVTSAPREIVLPFLHRIGWITLFDALTFADEVRHAKPHPAIYRAARKKSCTKAEQIVVVEDSTHGVASAKSAGLRVIAIGGASRNARRSGTAADCSIATLPELFALITSPQATP